MIMGIDHVGLAVGDASAASGVFAGLVGHPAGGVEALDEQLVRVCFLPIGDVALEILESMDAESPLARFLTRRGEGLHHVCFAVDDIHAEMRRLVGAGFQLIDTAPRRGHSGLIAFVHPKSAHGVLVELLQRDTSASAAASGSSSGAAGEHG